MKLSEIHIRDRLFCRLRGGITYSARRVNMPGRERRAFGVIYPKT